MRKTIILSAMMLCSLLGKAQEAPKWINNVKLSGFGIVQYQYNGMNNNKSNTFNLRLGRISLDVESLMTGIGKHSCKSMATHQHWAHHHD